MANSFISKLITELTAKTTASDTDLVPIADSSGNFFKMTFAKLKELITSELNTNLSNGFRMYNSLSALGLSNGKTINQVLYAMPQNSEFWCYFADMTGITDIPEAQTFVHAIKCGNIQMVEAISLWGDHRYIGGYKGNGEVLGWKKYIAS